MRRRVALAGVLAAAAAGCGGDDEAFRLKIQWRDGADQGCPPLGPEAERRCQSIPMTCAARARIRIVDALDPQLSYFTECFELTAGGDACKLGLLEIPRRAIPNRMVKVQVAVWPVSSLIDVEPQDMQGGCPVSARYQLNGLPALDAPVPALGGEAYFDVGHDRTAEVELGCPDSDELECRSDKVTVVASLFDLGFRRPTPTEVSRITVKFGTPVDDDNDGTWTIDNDQLQQLTLQTVGESRWNLVLDARPTGVRCLSVDYLEAGSTTALTCFEPVIGADNRLLARGFIVRRSMISDVLTSISRPTFPPEGMVIGLALDETDLPIEDAVVASVPPSMPMYYPSPSFPPLARDRTSQLGMFVSLTAPFDADWAAIAPGGGTDNGQARGGRVAEHVSVVVVNLGAQLTPLDAGLTAPADAGVDGP